MDELIWAEFAFLMGLINGLFAMVTNSILFGSIGLLFAGTGFLLMFRG